MGEVYRARDTRLDRTVAVKVLPAHLARNPELRAALRARGAGHLRAEPPAHLRRSTTSGSRTAIDLPRHGVRRGRDARRAAEERAPLPLDQALRYGIEIAQALHARPPGRGSSTATSSPATSCSRSRGEAARLRAGQAAGPRAPRRPRAPTLSALPTEEGPLTAEGSVLGTFQYMAPEQLEGKEADARTDIFAFGAVLYEMATGQRAFTGKSQASLIAGDPHVGAAAGLADSAPDAAGPRPVVAKCLAKDPDDRWQSAHDLASELKWIAEVGHGHRRRRVGSRRPWRGWLAWGLAAALAIATTTLVWRSPKTAPSALPAGGHVHAPAAAGDRLRLRRRPGPAGALSGRPVPGLRRRAPRRERRASGCASCRGRSPRS